jgi:hypothetical protein
MFDHVAEFFFRYPKSLLVFGRSLMQLAFVATSVGLIGLRANGAIRTLSGDPEGWQGIWAAIYPPLLSWWIPETILGFLFAASIFAFGWGLAISGKKLARFSEIA